MVPPSVDPTSYRNGTDRQYTVNSGRRFELLCISTGEFRGKVTWGFKRNSEGMLIVVSH